jgi:hypothetical protein
MARLVVLVEVNQNSTKNTTGTYANQNSRKIIIGAHLNQNSSKITKKTFKPK